MERSWLTWNGLQPGAQLSSSQHETASYTTRDSEYAETETGTYSH